MQRYNNRWTESEIAQIRERYKNIPSYIIDSLACYINDGVVPDDFLKFILEDDMHNAVVVGNEDERKCLSDIILLIQKHAPEGSWGHCDSIKEWRRGTPFLI